MAYAAVISLKQTIERLLKSSHIPVVLNPSPRIVELLYEEVCSLQEVLKELDSSSHNDRINRKRVNALDGQIRDALYEFEDVIESRVSNQFLSQSPDLHPLSFSLDLQEVQQDIDSFIEKVKKMKKAYVEELHNPLPPEEDDRAASSEIDLGGNKSYMVGISDLYQTVIYDVLYDDEFRTVSLYGAAGVGKTTLAREICEDPSIFECRAFVTIGPKYQLKEILKCILAQVDPDCDILLMEEDEELLSEYVYRSLNCWLLYLIVLDDVWDLQVWHELKRSFPDEEEESEGRFLVTTRSREVAESCFAGRGFEVPFLDKEESWNLLRQRKKDC